MRYNGEAVKFWRDRCQRNIRSSLGAAGDAKEQKRHCERKSDRASSSSPARADWRGSFVARLRQRRRRRRRQASWRRLHTGTESTRRLLVAFPSSFRSDAATRSFSSYTGAGSFLAVENNKKKILKTIIKKSKRKYFYREWHRANTEKKEKVWKHFITFFFLLYHTGSPSESASCQEISGFVDGSSVDITDTPIDILPCMTFDITAENIFLELCDSM